MFSIDLLKGQGLPEKNSFLRKSLRAAGVLLPLAALAVLTGAWQYDRTQITGYEKTIADNERLASQHSGDVTNYRQTAAYIQSLRKQFEQVNAALCCRIQITDLFSEFVDKLPGEIFIYEIKLDRTATKEKYQAEGMKEARQRTVIRRNMTLVLCDFNSTNGDRLVQDYIAELKESKLTASVFTEIKPAARQQGMVDNREVTYYYIECTLQEQSQ